MTDKPNVTNHYGVYVAPDVPTTGVVHNNAAEWLSDEMYDGINLTYEEALAEYEADPQAWLDEYGFDETPETFRFDESWESFGNETYLLGGWTQDENGQYEPDTTSEYSAVSGETYTQVIHSQYVERCALCSPCYPGQASIGDNGDYLAYTLPLSLWGDGLEPERKAHIRLQTALYQGTRLHEVTRRFLKRQEPVRYLKSVLAQVKTTLESLSE